MLHTIIDPQDATAGNERIGKDLALLAAGLDTRFLRAGETLAIAIGTIDRLLGGLDDVARALDPDHAGAAVANLQRIADRLAHLPAAQELRLADAAAIAAGARALKEDVMDMHQMLRVLSIYGMNIKVTACGESSFVNFVDGMEDKLGMGERQLTGIVNKLKDLAAGIASAQQAERLLSRESTKIMPHVPERLASDAAALDGHLAMIADIARRGAAIARAVQGKVAVVLGALQVGDSTRQRLEHVVSALHLLAAHGDTTTPAAEAHVHRLLVAQLHAIARDFTREAKALTRSLADLGPAAGGLLTLIDEQAGGDGPPFLACLDQGISDVAQLTTALRDAEQRSTVMTGVVAEAVGELTERLANVHRIKQDVQIIATNTRLLCRRHGALGKAVSVIAAEVDVYALELGEATGRVAGSITTLTDVNLSMQNAIEGPGREDAGEVLAAALAVIRQACQLSDQLVAQGGDDARQLIDLLADTAATLAEEMSVGGIMEAAAATLALNAPDLPIDDAAEAGLHILLPAIASLYTMASEREIHAPHHLATLPPLIAAVMVEEDEDDDGLF